MESVTPSQNKAHVVMPFYHTRTISKFKGNAEKPLFPAGMTS